MIKSPWVWIHEKRTTGVHGVGASTLLHTGSTGLITYDLLHKQLFSRLLNQNVRRTIWNQFDTYDMIIESLAGTGSTIRTYNTPGVTSAATNDTACLYANATLLNMIGNAGYTTLFQTPYTYMNVDTIDCEAFLGISFADNTVILSTTNNKHYVGFLYTVDGATKKVYAVNCDAGGAGHITATEIGTDPATYASTWIYSIGTTIYFYRNGVLVATHTTNIPTTLGAWKLCIKGLEDGAVYLSSRGYTYLDYVT